jgi:hypothetical protein
MKSLRFDIQIMAEPKAVWFAFLVEADSISAYEGIYEYETFPLALIEIKKLAESISE